MNAIEIRNLSKSFRGMYAVDHLNMTVPKGAIYGFIGENGSGKSTTEKMICGLIPKSGGSLGGGMLLFMTVSMITPLSSTLVNVALCGVGGILFAFGLGAISNIVLKKTSMV